MGGPRNVRVLKGHNVFERSSNNKYILPAAIPTWKHTKPPLKKLDFYQQKKRRPKAWLHHRDKVNHRYNRPVGNSMTSTDKYARLSALASFMGYRFPMKYTRDQTLCIYRYYLPPPTMMRVSRGDTFGSRFPYTDWVFMNKNRIYNAKYYNMFYHLLIKGKNAEHNKGRDISMKLINEGVLLNNYPHPLLPLLRAYIKQQSIEYTQYPDYEPIFHFVLTALFVPDSSWFLRYLCPYIFTDRRNIKLVAKLLTICTDIRALHLVQFYDRTFVRKLSYRYARLPIFRAKPANLSDRRKFIYSGRRPVEDYMTFEQPPYEK